MTDRATHLQPAPSRLPWRALAALTVAVLGLHLVLLEAAPTSMRFEEPLLTHRFVTRTLVLNPPAATPAAAIATPLPAPVPVAVRRPRPPGATPPAASVAVPTAPPDNTAAVEPVTSAVSQAPPAVPTAPAAPTAPATPEPVTPAPPALPFIPPTVATAFTIPGSARLQYMVSGQQGSQPLGGVTADLVWLQDGDTYEAQLSFRLLFRTLRSQRSTGRITRAGLEPERFLDRRRAEVAAHFERDKGKISFSANTPDAPLLTGAQDRLSLFLQLASVLAGNPAAYPAGTTITVQTAGPRDADVWVFTVGGPETLALPAGEVPAVKLMRNPRREMDQKVEAWFAPSLDYLPVKLRITDASGDMVEQQLRASGPP